MIVAKYNPVDWAIEASRQAVAGRWRIPVIPGAPCAPPPRSKSSLSAAPTSSSWREFKAGAIRVTGRIRPPAALAANGA
jgi:hypothetical protein